MGRPNESGHGWIDEGITVTGPLVSQVVLICIDGVTSVARKVSRLLYSKFASDSLE